MNKSSIEIAKLVADIDRKNKLLKEALEQLLACEWEVNLGVIGRYRKRAERWKSLGGKISI